MSTQLIPVITRAGLAAVFNTQGTGLAATISHLALGDGGWEPDNSATELVSEKRRIAVTGERVDDDQIHLTGVEDGGIEYWVREIGVYLSDGTLLAIWSDTEQPLAYKSPGVDLLLIFDLALSALPAGSVSIGDKPGFNLPVATPDKPGLLRIATPPEVSAGASDECAVSPAQLNRYFSRYGQLKIITGVALSWAPYQSAGIVFRVNIPDTLSIENYHVVTNLTSGSSHWLVVGVTSIFPTSTGFNVYVGPRNDDTYGGIENFRQTARTYEWEVHWALIPRGQ